MKTDIFEWKRNWNNILIRIDLNFDKSWTQVVPAMSQRYIFLTYHLNDSKYFSQFHFVFFFFSYLYTYFFFFIHLNIKRQTHRETTSQTTIAVQSKRSGEWRVIYRLTAISTRPFALLILSASPCSYPLAPSSNLSLQTLPHSSKFIHSSRLGVTRFVV